MRSSSNQSRRIPVRVFLLLCVLSMGGCWKHDSRSATIERTVSELRATAESWDSYHAEHLDSNEYDGCAGLYLAPAYRRASRLLEKDGADALPIPLIATFAHGFDVSANVTGWAYMFEWLDLDDEVRGFYLRSEGEPDVDLYPALSKEPQVPNTAQAIAGGPVLLSEKERSKVPAQWKGSEIVLDARVLARKKVLVGLILTDGRKTAPIEAYIREGDKKKKR